MAGRGMRAGRVAVCVFVAVGGAMPAHAQEGGDLSSCLDSVAAAQGATGERLFDPRACIGTVEFLCSETGGGDCLAREQSEWQALAEEALGTLSDAAATPDIAAALKDNQAEWERWMAVDCDLVAPFSDDPTVTSFARDYCLRDAWADRAIALRARVGSVF
jgi:hypothetical protein